jgi:hypothetical protein
MSIQVALDSDGEIITNEKGAVFVEEGRYTIQAVRSALLCTLGEYALDPKTGWMSRSDFAKRPDLFDIESRARSIILGVYGVSTVDDLTVSLGSNRQVTCEFTAKTIYGDISLSVPWS